MVWSVLLKHVVSPEEREKRLGENPARERNPRPETPQSTLAHRSGPVSADSVSTTPTTSDLDPAEFSSSSESFSTLGDPYKQAMQALSALIHNSKIQGQVSTLAGR
ncbi:hypothetical protein GX51_07989 [Blastomyces parvus]|uniref:Uncharacterized protein n=1 Tax=Blastomyces parvus TaxID=2060905 RepID=A0A2B7WHN6_9EURO|nr:hypothetical protein GX51_07989 [Blastomyces parvus]